MEPLKNTVDQVMAGLYVKKSPSLDAGPEQWLKKTLTKKELGHIKFHYFRKGTLGVRVDSSAWMYSLSLKKENLLGKLKAQAPDIKEIRFSIGEIK